MCSRSLPTSGSADCSFERAGAQLGATDSENIELRYAFVSRPKRSHRVPRRDARAALLLRVAIRHDDRCCSWRTLSSTTPRARSRPSRPPSRPTEGSATCRHRHYDRRLFAVSAVVTEVAHRLQDDGVDIKAIDLRSLCPLERNTLIASVSKTDVRLSRSTTGSPAVSAPRSSYSSPTARRRIGSPAALRQTAGPGGFALGRIALHRGEDGAIVA